MEPPTVVRFRKTHPNGRTPTQAHASDAGFDLYAATVEPEGPNIKVDFGIAMEIPAGHVGLIFPRSSISKTDLFLRNHVGVIDSGYRGSVTAKFGQYPFAGAAVVYKTGERVAQLIVVPIPTLYFHEVDELGKSDRDVGGYGSSGK